MEKTPERLGRSMARVKIWGRSTPQGPKYGLSKKLTWVGRISPLNLRDFSGPKLTELLSPNAGGIAV